METTRTFAEVVANGGRTKVISAKKGTEENEVKEVCWNGAYEDNTWLSKCAIRVLKRFDKYGVSNPKKDCTSFIIDIFLWEDSFSIMENGSSKAVATSRIAWINFMGVLLSHWNSEFFFEIGKQVEPLLIDDNTLFKRRLFKGRLLILIRHGNSCPKYISINDGRDSFWLLVEEERTPVELRWIENFLDLVLRKPKRWNRGQGQVESRNSIGQPECQDREGKGIKGVRQISNFVSNQNSLGGPIGAANDEIQLLENGDGHYKPVKGKNIRIPSPNRYLPLHNYANSNNKLILEKTKVIGVFKDQSSSFNSEMERGPFMNSVKCIGECSTQRKNLIGQTLLDRGVELVQDLVDFSVKDGPRDDGLDIDGGNIVGLVSTLGGLGFAENNGMDLDDITTKANDVRLIGSSKAIVQTTEVEMVDFHINLGSISA
ncbi:hypothetical protein Q3G72_027518 [Acer saccharum]|nr:hypothetical protein Q3G72_027518 [Acer saccharum]